MLLGLQKSVGRKKTKVRSCCVDPEIFERKIGQRSVAATADGIQIEPDVGSGRTVARNSARQSLGSNCVSNQKVRQNDAAETIGSHQTAAGEGNQTKIYPNEKP